MRKRCDCESGYDGYYANHHSGRENDHDRRSNSCDSIRNDFEVFLEEVTRGHVYADRNHLLPLRCYTVAEHVRYYRPGGTDDTVLDHDSEPGADNDDEKAVLLLHDDGDDYPYDFQGIDCVGPVENDLPNDGLRLYVMVVAAPPQHELSNAPGDALLHLLHYLTLIQPLHPFFDFQNPSFSLITTWKENNEYLFQYPLFLLNSLLRPRRCVVAVVLVWWRVWHLSVVVHRGCGCGSDWLMFPSPSGRNTKAHVTSHEWNFRAVTSGLRKNLRGLPYGTIHQRMVRDPWWEIWTYPTTTE